MRIRMGLILFMARRFRIFLIAIAAGIAARQLASFEPIALLAIISLGAVAASIVSVRRPREMRAVLLAVGGVTVGALVWSLHVLNPPSVASPSLNEKVKLEGWVRDVRYQNARFATFELQTILPESLPAAVLVRSFGGQTLSYGDRVMLDCVWKEARGADRTCVSSRMAILSRGTEGNVFFRLLGRLRADIGDRIASLLPQPESAVVSAMVMGRDEALPAKLSQAFRATGLSHLLVFSGMNVLIILKFIDIILQSAFVSRVARGAALIAAAFVVLGLVGFAPSSVRASLMAVIAIAFQLLGRGRAAFHTLVVVGAAMVISAPALVSDVSFQLSFAATAGIILWERGATARLMALGLWHEIASALGMTLSAMALTTPIIAAFAPIVGAWVIISNAGVGILSAMVVPLSLIALIASWLAPAIAPVVAMPLSALVWVIVGSVEALSSFQSFPLAQSPLVVAASYMIVVIGIFVVWKRSARSFADVFHAPFRSN